VHYVEPSKPRSKDGTARRRGKTTAVKNDPGDVITMAVPSIIDRELFDKVQQLIRSGKRDNSGKHKHEYLFVNGRLKCICGRSLSGFFESKRGGKRWYRCTRSKDVKSCGNIVMAEYVENLGWDIALILLDYDQAYLRLELQRRAEETFKPTYKDEDFVAVERSLAECAVKLKRWSKAYENGTIELPEYSQYVSGVKNEMAILEKLRSDIDADRNRQHQHVYDTNAAIDLVTRIKKELPAYSLAERRRVIEMLDLRITYQDREHYWPTLFLPVEFDLDPSEVFDTPPTSSGAH
jgi:hypothetical protein